VLHRFQCLTRRQSGSSSNLQHQAIHLVVYKLLLLLPLALLNLCERSIALQLRYGQQLYVFYEVKRTACQVVLSASTEACRTTLSLHSSLLLRVLIMLELACRTPVFSKQCACMSYAPDEHAIRFSFLLCGMICCQQLVRPFVTTPGTFILTERSLIFEPVSCSSTAPADTAVTTAATAAGNATAGADAVTATTADDSSSCDSAAAVAAAIEDGFVLVPTVAELQSSELSDSRPDSADVAACNTTQQQPQQQQQQQSKQQQQPEVPQGSHTWVLRQCDAQQHWELSLLARIAPRAHLHQVLQRFNLLDVMFTVL
jgi:hypothetical protein